MNAHKKKNHSYFVKLLSYEIYTMFAVRCISNTCHKGEQRSVLGNWRVILLFTLSVNTLITNCIASSASFKILGNHGTALKGKINESKGLFSAIQGNKNNRRLEIAGINHKQREIRQNRI